MRCGLRSRCRKFFPFLQINPEVNGWSGLPVIRFPLTSKEHASGQSRVQAVIVASLRGLGWSKVRGPVRGLKAVMERDRLGHSIRRNISG